jgi:hypothetical protein
MARIVTGLFHKRRDVDLVIEHLVQEFETPRERIQALALDASGAEAHSPQDSDLDASLADMGLPDEAVRSYAEGMRRGSVVLAAWVDEAHLRQAWRVYREYGAASVGAYEEPAGSGGRDEQIRLRAYHLWEEAGRPEGRDLEFWCQARQAAGNDEDTPAARAPRLFAGETGAASLPEPDTSSDR